MNNDEIVYKIRNGEIDVNNQSRFFSILIKGLLVALNNDISIRNNRVPHYIINTGDEIMALEVKGYDHSKDPVEATNENYIYTVTPRCAITPKNIQLIPDQLTSPYAAGKLQLDIDDQLINFVGEVRRMPLKMNIELKYVVNSYTDTLELIQQIITKLAFIRSFNIVYMGQVIPCSYTLPDSLDDEKTIDFDENSTDDRRYFTTLDIEVETAIPIYSNGTIIPADQYIKKITTSPFKDSNLSHRLTVLPVNGIELKLPGEDPHAPYPKKE